MKTSNFKAWNEGDIFGRLWGDGLQWISLYHFQNIQLKKLHKMCCKMMNTFQSAGNVWWLPSSRTAIWSARHPRGCMLSCCTTAIFWQLWFSNKRWFCSWAVNEWGNSWKYHLLVQIGWGPVCCPCFKLADVPVCQVWWKFWRIIGFIIW